MFRPFSLFLPFLPVLFSHFPFSSSVCSPRSPVDELTNLTNFLLSFLHISLAVSTYLFGLLTAIHLTFCTWYTGSVWCSVLKTRSIVPLTDSGIGRDSVFNWSIQTFVSSISKSHILKWLRVSWLPRLRFNCDWPLFRHPEGGTSNLSRTFSSCATHQLLFHRWRWSILPYFSLQG